MAKMNILQAIQQLSKDIRTWTTNNLMQKLNKNFGEENKNKVLVVSETGDIVPTEINFSGEGGDVDHDRFSSIQVGEAQIIAEGADNFEIAAGNNVTLEVSDDNKITVNSENTTYPALENIVTADQGKIFGIVDEQVVRDTPENIIGEDKLVPSVEIKHLAGYNFVNQGIPSASVTVTQLGVVFYKISDDILDDFDLQNARLLVKLTPNDSVNTYLGDINSVSPVYSSSDLFISGGYIEGSLDFTFAVAYSAGEFNINVFGQDLIINIPETGVYAAYPIGQTPQLFIIFETTSRQVPAYERFTNKVKTIDENSTHEQYPSARYIYNNYATKQYVKELVPQIQLITWEADD